MNFTLQPVQPWSIGNILKAGFVSWRGGGGGERLRQESNLCLKRKWFWRKICSMCRDKVRFGWLLLFSRNDSDLCQPVNLHGNWSQYIYVGVLAMAGCCCCCCCCWLCFKTTTIHVIRKVDSEACVDCGRDQLKSCKPWKVRRDAFLLSVVCWPK